MRKLQVKYQKLLKGAGTFYPGGFLIFFDCLRNNFLNFQEQIWLAY